MKRDILCEAIGVNFPGLTRYLSGVLVPVSALRTERSIGVGEFADLPELAAWCARVGLDLIQILPVNDTGWQPSPYSALTAFGLHPLYLRVTDLPEYESLQGEGRGGTDAHIARIRASHDSDSRIRYGALRDEKLALLRSIYERSISADGESGKKVRAFADQHEWVWTYAGFKTLKQRNGGAPWTEWNELRDPTPSQLAVFVSNPSNAEELLFHVWLQQRLHEQLLDAARRVADLGITLKGDLPILINEDSADAWMHREYFSGSLRAGSPPDAESALGQNWGLPVYDWDALAADDYSWWRNRLRQASSYYAAYRIDHVLGFFRVWSIPAGDLTGYLGHYEPGATAARERLHELGMDDARIRWLAEPHIPGEWIRSGLGEEADEVLEDLLDQVEDQDLYRLGESVRSESDIASLPLSEDARSWLMGQYRNRALIRIKGDRFVNAWSYGECSRFRELPEEQKEPVWRLAGELFHRSEKAWEDQGRRLLSMMRETGDMLACAEDLGAIPAVVPGVLAELGILGLRIPRWARRWNQEGQPFIPVTEYPFLTVCASSVHDTSTLRGWWNEEEKRGPFWASLGQPDAPPTDYDADTAKRVVASFLNTSSALCVFQIQDLLALAAEGRQGSPEEERVNVPGTMSEFNWGYRLPGTLEELLSNEELNAVLIPLLRDRRQRSIT